MLHLCISWGQSRLRWWAHLHLCPRGKNNNGSLSSTLLTPSLLIITFPRTVVATRSKLWSGREAVTFYLLCVEPTCQQASLVAASSVCTACWWKKPYQVILLDLPRIVSSGNDLYHGSSEALTYLCKLHPKSSNKTWLLALNARSENLGNVLLSSQPQHYEHCLHYHAFLKHHALLFPPIWFTGLR